MPEAFANNIATTLAADVSSGATTLTVASSSNFPAASTSTGTQFRAAFVSGATVLEYLIVTNISGTTWTVTRAAEDATRYPSGARTAGTTLAHLVTAGALAGMGGSSRTTASYTTASLAANGTETGTITMAKSYRLLRIQTTAPARVRLYTNAAAQTADTSRGIGTDPSAGAGVVLDYVTTASVGTSAAADLSPLVDGANTETTPSSSIPITVTAVSAGAITVTLTYLPQES